MFKLPLHCTETEQCQQIILTLHTLIYLQGCLGERSLELSFYRPFKCICGNFCVSLWMEPPDFLRQDAKDTLYKIYYIGMHKIQTLHADTQVQACCPKIRGIVINCFT